MTVKDGKKEKVGLQLLLQPENKSMFDVLAKAMGIPTTAWIIMAMFEKYRRDMWVLEELKNTANEKEAVAKVGVGGEEAN